jgi:hypothetical protein
VTFIFVDKPAMEGVAASTTGLAADTGALARQIQAAVAELLPPGNDPVSLRNVAFIRGYLGQVITQLTADSGLQDARAMSIAAGAAAYQATDEVGAAQLMP